MRNLDWRDTAAGVVTQVTGIDLRHVGLNDNLFEFQTDPPIYILDLIRQLEITLNIRVDDKEKIEVLDKKSINMGELYDLLEPHFPRATASRTK